MSEIFCSATTCFISSSSVNTSNSWERVGQEPVIAFSSSLAIPAWIYSSVTPGFRFRTMPSQKPFTSFFSSFSSS